jgi:hypothetical protein
MILRFDRIAMELQPPSDPDPAGAAAVQTSRENRYARKAARRVAWFSRSSSLSSSRFSDSAALDAP